MRSASGVPVSSAETSLAGRATSRIRASLQLCARRWVLNTAMTVDIDRAAKPMRKLRKLLKNFPTNPRPEQVHSLRTQTRRLEATLHALSGEATKDTRRLLKLLKPVRRSAGTVRDMDVLITKLVSLNSHASEEGMVRLVEHLSSMRMEHVNHLQRVVKRRRNEARGRLRRAARHLERSRSGDSPLVIESPAAPQIVATELDHWPKLHRDNLHEFRKQVKELRYMLQLAPGSDGHLLEAFGQVKDTAGEWHDWLQLENLAHSVLDPAQDGALLRDIRSKMREKLRVALTAANELRRNGFELPLAA